jgi:ubiquinone/menaquinone biosynthesis C-methylase UbiE
MLKKLFSTHIFPKYKQKIAGYITGMCEDNSKILDVGCDDGSLAVQIMKINPTLRMVGIDIQANRPAKIPRKIYNGRKIPYKNKSFDIAIAVDVLHHTKNIPELLKEMKRVSKKYIIIKDHVTNTKLSRFIHSAIDYLLSRLFRIQYSANFLSSRQWNILFRNFNLRIIKQPRKLNLKFGMTEKTNLIVKLKTSSAS